MRFVLRQFVDDAPRCGLVPAFATLYWNLRFNLGYRIGGFTSAQRNYGDEPNQ